MATPAEQKPALKPFRVLRAQGAEVRMYRQLQHGEYRYVVSYYTSDGLQRITRTSRKEADIEADAALRKLITFGPQMRTIDRGTADLLDRLRALGEPVSLVSQMETAMRVLSPTGLSIEEAARAVANHTPEGFVPAVLEDAYAKFEALYQHRDRSPETWATLKKNIAPFKASFQRRVMHTITFGQLEAWASQLTGGARYRKNILTATTTFFRQVQRWRHLPVGVLPISQVARPRVLVDLPAVLTPTQAHKALECLAKEAPQLVVAFAIAAFAGLRPTELCRGTKEGRKGRQHGDALRWADIDLAHGNINLRAKVAGKTGQNRFVPIEANLAAWLHAYSEKAQDRRGTDAARVCGTHDLLEVRKLLKARKIVAVWPKDVLRHSYATYHHALHKDLGALASNMGNSEAVIRRHYRQPRLAAEAAAWFSIMPGAGKVAGFRVVEGEGPRGIAPRSLVGR